MKVLVAGGAGYIGSTICSALKDEGHTPIILDSLVTGEQSFAEQHTFYRGDIDDLSILQTIVANEGPIDYVIHLAAFILVPESVSKPYQYYRQNVSKTIEFLNNLNTIGCKNIIFSSSASIYGNATSIEVTEESPINPGSPYAKTKAMLEEIIQDYCNAYDMKAISLRYFNPIGADPSMRTGGFVKNPSHLLAKLLQAYYSESKTFTITGVNWDTRDGSGIRDYIHIWDLALAHVKAVEKMDTIFQESVQNYYAINIGRGQGITVKEFVKEFEETVQTKLNILEGPPRDGDVLGAYANCERSKKMLGWEAKLSIRQGIKDAIKWEERKNSK